MRRIIFIAALMLPGVAFAQSAAPKRVTLQLTDVTLEKAIAILAVSYDTPFSYSDDVVPVDRIVSLTAANETLTDVLEKLLKPLQVGYKIVNHRVILKRESLPLTQTIRGSIVDQITNDIIPSATVTIQSGDIVSGSTSDFAGIFKVINVPVGRVTIVFSSVGYVSQTISNLLLGTGKELVLDVRLSQAVTEMEAVVISAEKHDPLPGNDMALTSARTFSVEDTKRYAGSLGDPARMVTAFAGVTASNDESNALVVRGNSPRGMLWRIEGIEVPNPNHFTTEGASGGVVSALSSNMVERSDFLTGAFPAQYGNALSGVFDINLRNGNNERREHSLNASLLGVEASTEGPLAKSHATSYLFNYRYSTLSILDKLGSSLNEVGQYKNYQDLSFKIHSNTKAGTFSLFGLGGKSDSDQARENLFNNSSSNVGVLGLTYRKTIDEKTSVQGALSLSGTRIGRDNEISGSTGALVQVEEQYAKSYARVSISANRRISARYTVEGGLIHSNLNYNFYLRNRDPDNIAYPEIINFKERGTTSISQAFLYARQYFSPALFGYYGVHFLRFALTNDQSLEPRLGIRWQPEETWSLGIAYGKHSRIENLQYYLARDHQTGGNEIQINKDLGFTRAHHVVISYDQRIIKHLKFKAEVYYQQLYNAPVLSDLSSIYSSINEDTGFITDTLVNKGKGQNYGIELSLEKTFANQFYYLINGSLYESKFRIDDRSEWNTAYNGNYNIHLLGGKEIPMNRNRDRLGLNFKITSAGGKRYIPVDEAKSVEMGKLVYQWDRAFEDKLPDYFRADFQIVYKKDCPRYSIEWRLDIQNITDHRNAVYYYFDPSSESVRLKKTVGFLPLASCRIDF